MFKFSSHYLLLITFSTLKEFQTNRCLHFGYEGPAHKQLNRMSHECWAVLWLEQKGGVRHQSYTVLWRQAVQHLSFSEQTFSVLRPYAPLWAISCSRKLCPPFVIEAWVSLADLHHLSLLPRHRRLQWVQLSTLLYERHCAPVHKERGRGTLITYVREAA